MMRDFVGNYLLTAQLLYDLLPLASVIAEDPYLNDFGPGKTFITNYRKIIERAHNDLIR